MNVYKIHDIGELIKDNPYVGRGIVIGKSENGKSAVSAYFIMGRSNNSRNRVFVKHGTDLFTEPYDSSKVEDPSLIIYAAVRETEGGLIVTNGDQTDTVYEGLAGGLTFSDSLKSREFEPDAPNLTPRRKYFISSIICVFNLTPRISGYITFGKCDFSYEMSILKSADPLGTACNRYTFSYPSLAGLGHFIHTYVTDGNPIPTFLGEPERVAIPDSIDSFTETLWTNLNADNKISLYVRYTDLESGEITERIINKNS